MSLRDEIQRRVAALPAEQLPLLAQYLDEVEERKQFSPINKQPQISFADWPHAPLHRVSEAGTYMVTCGTLHKEHFFAGPDRLELLQSALLRSAKAFGWQIEAWAVFSNHYHFVGHANQQSRPLRAFIKSLHGQTSQDINLLDAIADRQVWHNYWDTKLTFEKSYLARLNYVLQNPVRHGLVPVANQYRWCSAAWFERTATRAQVKTIYGFKIDRVNVPDEFDPI